MTNKNSTRIFTETPAEVRELFLKEIDNPIRVSFAASSAQIRVSIL